jgi:hypothetical protein
MNKLHSLIGRVLTEKIASKSTCCMRCGRKHKKGTPCKKPYLSKDNPRHCKNRKWRKIGFV